MKLSAVSYGSRGHNKNILKNGRKMSNMETAWSYDLTFSPMAQFLKRLPMGVLLRAYLEGIRGRVLATFTAQIDTM